MSKQDKPLTDEELADCGLLSELSPVSELVLPAQEWLGYDDERGENMYGYTSDQLRAAIAADRAARVPVLTDEQIEDIWATVSIGYDDTVNVIALARAVLAAAQGCKP